MVKISLSQLEKSIEEGGLKMINLSCFHKALKLLWVKRLILDEENWQRLLEFEIGLSKKFIFFFILLIH